MTVQHFSEISVEYAEYRPSYPPELAEMLAALAPGRWVAMDVGCGNGQFSLLLARHFEQVTATDVSAEQIAQAPPHPRVRFLCEAAESLSAGDKSIDLVVAAQAAHWFELPKFFSEVRRVLVAQGVVALVTYGVLSIDGSLNERFQRFYWDEVHPYWPPERHHVETGYAQLDFPFEELAAPEMPIVRDWNLSQFLGYVQTWTATRKALQAGKGELVTAFENEMTTLWGEPSRIRRISWPIAMRIGKL